MCRHRRGRSPSASARPNPSRPSTVPIPPRAIFKVKIYNAKSIAARPAEKEDKPKAISANANQPPPPPPPPTASALPIPKPPAVESLAKHWRRFAGARNVMWWVGALGHRCAVRTPPPPPPSRLPFARKNPSPWRPRRRRRRRRHTKNDDDYVRGREGAAATAERLRVKREHAHNRYASAAAPRINACAHVQMGAFAKNAWARGFD